MSGIREAERVVDLTKKEILIRSKRSTRELLLCEAQIHLSAVLQNYKQFESLFDAYLRDEADEKFANLLHDLSFKIENNMLYLCAGSQHRVTLNDIQQLVTTEQWTANKRRKVTPRRVEGKTPPDHWSDKRKQDVTVVMRERVPIKVEEGHKPSLEQ